MDASINEGTEEREPKEQAESRCYSTYSNSGQLEFCPFSELNLPKNYDEVVSRFKRLQGERAVEILN
jgi:hypothetical protein